jgi:heme exporter protein D
MIAERIVYVVSAYGVSALVIALLTGWIFIARHNHKRELRTLEAAGVKRRSEA